MMRPIGPDRGECFVRRWSDSLLPANPTRRRDTDGLQRRHTNEKNERSQVP
ncbi:hypothetical protein GG496_002460 [Candidatus Fervidibacteria bacterium JGI MDM2 JNZ-1-D12]